MFISIYFCADGILRAKHNDEPLIPISFIQKNSDKNDDFSFWAQWWKYNVYFEKGLTLVNFFHCIEPWNDFFSTLTGVDIDTYLKEMKKPCSIEKQTRMDYIEICKEVLLEPEIQYLDTLDIEEMIALINSQDNDVKKRLAKLTGLWDFNDRTSIHAFLKGNNNRYTFMLSHPEVMANVPIVLNSKQAVYFSNHITQKFIDKNISVFNEELPSVINNSGSGEILMTDISYSFREVIEMFFSSIDKTPQMNRDFMNMVYERVKSHQDYLTSIKDKPAIEENNVVSIQTGKAIVSEDNPEKKEETVTFHTSSDFIEDIGQVSSPEKQLWDFLLEKASKDNIVLRIGKIEEQIMPEVRLMGKIISEENYIKPSNNKEI